MVIGHRVLISLGVGALIAASATLVGAPARVSAAASCNAPNTPCDIYAGGSGPFTSAAWTGGPIQGNPDPVGPPSPVCNPGSCDRTTFVLHAPAGFTTGNVITVTATATFAPGPSGATADVAILDGSNNVLGSTIASSSPATAVAADLAPGTYVVEVDGDIGDPTDTSFQGSVSVSSGARVAPPTYPQGPPIGFATPTILDPIHPVGEPSISVAPTGDQHVLGSGPAGTGTQRSIWEASADGGQTFRIVNQCVTAPNGVASQCPPPSAVTSAPNSSTTPGGGDTTTAFDSTGKGYFADLWALACDRVATTINYGATALQNAYGCNSATSNPASRPDGSDRQWVVVYDPGLTPGIQTTAPDAALGKVIYMEYNTVVNHGHGCSYWVKSTDGLNYSPANNNSGNFGCDGYPSVDQLTGKVLEASGCGNKVCLNIGTPDASGNLTFLDDAAGGTNNLVTVANGLAGSPDDLFMVSSLDSGRNLHVVWGIAGSGTGANWQIFTSVSPAGPNNTWDQWATPVQVSAPPANVNIFPWIVAGGPGRSDLVWYGNSTIADPSSQNNQNWFTYMSQVVWPTDSNGHVAGTSATPASVTTPIQVSPHPMQNGAICLKGTGCIAAQGNRNIADFFSVTTDSTGAAIVMYNDTFNGIIQSPQTCATPQASDHCGAALVTIARQASGPGLFGASMPACTQAVYCTPSAPQTGMSDSSGDALYPAIAGANQPAFDITSNNLSLSGGNLTVTFKVADLTPTTLATNMATVSGTAFMQFVTRWQMGNKIYYAMLETDGALRQANQDQFYAGTPQSIDLCSVSACDPHVLFYPEAGTGANTVTGSVNCASLPCTVTISVPVADIGSPTNTSLLEEVGTYALAASHLQATITAAQAQNDNVPLEIDGVCCFNFQASTPNPSIPETPWTPALLGLGAALVGGGLALRRRRAAKTPIT